MKGCTEIREMFDARLDDRLEEGRLSAFDVHVAGCADCRREWETYRNLWAALERQPGIEPSFGFAERTLRRLHEQAKPVFWKLPAFRWISAASLCVILAAVVWMRWEQSRQTQYVQAYMAAHEDHLEDFDVIASLHELNGGTQL